ncbi:MAG: AIR synthase-related protein, partial [Pseudomonadota bacterium]
VGAIEGIGAACKALDMPIVSGNVSLYNETDGQPILPTPTIGAVGLIADIAHRVCRTAREGHVALLIGETLGHMGQSALLTEVFNRPEGDAPPVDLAAEKAAGDFILSHVALIDACTDLSDGGLALAAFEMAATADVGVHLTAEDSATLFGEDQARYLIATSFDKAEALMVAAGRAGVPIRSVGRFGGSDVTMGRSSAPLTELAAIYKTAFESAIL